MRARLRRVEEPDILTEKLASMPSSWTSLRSFRYSRCPRAWYYESVAAGRGCDSRASEDDRAAWRLGHMVTIAEFATAVIDDVVALALREIEHSQRIPSRQRLANRALKAFEAGWRDSFNGDWQKDISLTNLRELYYEPDEIDADIHAAWSTRLKAAIAGFCELPLLKQLCALPATAWQGTDQLHSFSLGDHTVWCRLDLAHKLPDGRLAIIKWHLEPIPETAIHPLHVGALLAEHIWQLPPERVFALSILLDTPPQVEEISLERSTLGAAEARIQEEATAMKAGGAEAANFALAEDAKTCQSCNFPAICPRFEELACY
jgi:hypothetical protein